MRTLSSVILIFICQLMSMYTYADSKELPELTDLSQLNLEIDKTEVVDEIQQDRVGKFVSTDDLNLVVVTLKGNVKSPCCIVVQPREFSAVCNMGHDYLLIMMSDAVGMDESWNLSREDAVVVARFPIKRQGPVSLKVAFFLPKQVNNFSVLYPTLAKGTATISMQGSKKTQK